MNRQSIWQRPLGKCALVLGLGALGATIATPTRADCSIYNLIAPPARWDTPVRGDARLVPAVYRPGSGGFIRVDHETSVPNGGIVGLWSVSFVSDGTAHPIPIPAGAVVDFGTVQWHDDGTELMVSGGRPPSTGDVCMGVWEQTGPFTYKLKHVALAWISSDTPPPQGPVSPAVFVGPAIIRALVTLSHHPQNTYQGTFTIDQYATDGTTLLEHIGGTVSGTRITVD
jgi:hypothetical protein